MKTNRTVEETVIALHEEGWQVPNIASIARVKPDVVKQILRDKKGGDAGTDGPHDGRCGEKAQGGLSEGRHYCDECWEHDDDDNIVTKDGRKWTDYDHKEIRQHRMNYLSLSEDMTLTQFRMELVKGRALFDSMVGTLYKSMLFDDLTEGKEWFEELLVTRKGTPEFDSYSTFASHGIFRQAQTDAYERMYNRNK